MKIAVSGSTGLVGSALVPVLRLAGHEVHPMVRARARDAQIAWSWVEKRIDAESLGEMDAVVHLAGESIAEGRWTADKKRRIKDSRVEGTLLIARALAESKPRPSEDGPPSALVCASAIGFYGERGAEPLDESSPPGEGFLAEVCRAWEAAAEPARQAGFRVVHLRFGVILSPDGGALKAMLLPFHLGLGGVVGSGEQFWSWIALEDAVGAIVHALGKERLTGPVNVVAPRAATNRVFTKTLGRVLRRPTLVPLPAPVARLVFGQKADELLLCSAKVEPGRLIETGYAFRHVELESGLRSALGRPSA
jgi:hypothetical protein